MRATFLMFVVVAACSACASYDASRLTRAGRMHELRDRLRAEPLPSSPDDRAGRAILLARALLDLRVYWDAATFDDALAALEGARPTDRRLAAELEQARGEIFYWRRLLGAGGAWRNARQHFERALEVRGAINDKRGIAESTFYLGLIAQLTGNKQEGRRLFERARDMARTLDDPLLLSYPIRHLGSLAEDAGDNDTALRLYEESLALRVKSGDVIRTFNARITLATFLCDRMRDCNRARPYVVEARRTADALRLDASDVAALEGRMK